MNQKRQTRSRIYKTTSLSQLSWSPGKKIAFTCALFSCVVVNAQGQPVANEAQDSTGWKVGIVLDAGATSKAMALGDRGKGLQLGHSDLTVSGALGTHLKAQLTGVAETHEGKLESNLDEAWLETTSLPMGLQMRAGRFASQVGYLNAQHPHADDFVERPLLYRALLGGHWIDDGLRLNWTAPTEKYLMFGMEVFRGKNLVGEAANAPGNLAAMAWVAKLGDDFNSSNSWQLGLSHIKNRREAAIEEHHGDEEQAEAVHDHHGAQYTGKNTWMLDGTWKWSPNGNNRTEQLKLGFEIARTTGLNRFASASDRHQSHALSAVWRFNPSWELGIRSDVLKVSQPLETHFVIAKMREHALMLAYKPTHMQTLRLQYTTQRNVTGFESHAKNAVQLQYVLAFGAHGAHPF